MPSVKMIFTGEGLFSTGVKVIFTGMKLVFTGMKVIFTGVKRVFTNAVLRFSLEIRSFCRSRTLGHCRGSVWNLGIL